MVAGQESGITNEKSLEALNRAKMETMNSIPDSTMKLEGYLNPSNDGYSVDNLIEANRKVTGNLTSAKQELAAFAGRDAASLSRIDAIRLAEALTLANGLGRGTRMVSPPQPYNEKGSTGLERHDETIRYFMQDAERFFPLLRAQITAMEGEAPPEKVGAANIAKMMEHLSGVQPEARQKWLGELKTSLAKAEKAVQASQELLASHADQLQASGPALRASERARHEASLELNRLEDDLRAKFNAVLESTQR